MTLEIIPALDLREGRVVRLRQGDYARETGYALDAVEQAQRYRNAGASRLHVVDLDGAREGRFENLSVIEALAKLDLDIQAGGGVRDEADIKRLFDAGVQRVVVGSVAVRECERVVGWIERYGAERLVIALDTREVDGRWTLSSAGWTEAAASTLDELAPRFAQAGARHLLCTDISRDGMLSGPNLDLYAHLTTIAPSLAVQASGGVRDLDDIKALQGRAAGVILGRSLLEGHLDVAGALRC
ncbi:MAG TPA: 1-(5-phosphoribosyl)-5-[(5-phosphoribosylamino)methylideneamino]imidazole-4-carboxamide isomerase [Dokdonella sp.]|uniref:1-(5-phosphoribosyl)-5-[(5- phosphoribosylamino)methylideneamino]imidazole-4- carboxamide isomerase n=1 Tax=Dokdonella sp. TaxID=2291710 RepID=UPI002D7E520A|nr:1-(5-phosphoribosyl)-5-[(5-phosphoribosylamino)methylideneamino]imidazole-4-carboxamide isomerase [Dokdonella sp.]HET9032625.1 1-(5-phosphoribosyl)-5-[(5-phosphoribosylamino)methylideneamino]imidazole-4-carboxamide isomerase [Dokdonella sp.]